MRAQDLRQAIEDGCPLSKVIRDGVLCYDLTWYSEDASDTTLNLIVDKKSGHPAIFATLPASARKCGLPTLYLEFLGSEDEAEGSCSPVLHKKHLAQA